jgi:hypothetical protein
MHFGDTLGQATRGSFHSFPSEGSTDAMKKAKVPATDLRSESVAGTFLCPVAPTLFRNEPFGENVERLSHCGDKS